MRASFPGSCGFCLIVLACTAIGLHAQEWTPVDLYRAKNRGLELAQRGKTDSALAIVRQIAMVDSADASLWRQYGRLAAQMNFRREAIRTFERTYELGAFNRAITALEIAKVYAAEGDATHALNWLERAVENRLQHPERLIDDSAFARLRDSARFAAIYPRGDPATLSRDERWRRDIDFFLREARRMHVHPDRPAHSREFADSVTALKARVPASTDMSLRLGLRRLVAMLRDGHSSVQRDSSMRLLPIDIYIFTDGFFVVHGIGSASSYTGNKVVAIGQRAIEDVARAVASFIPRDNDMDLRARLPSALINTSFLSEVGVANPDGSVDVTLQDRSGRRSIARLDGSPLRASRGLSAGTAAAAQPMYLERTLPYWTRDLPEARALYLNFNSVADAESLSIAEFSRRLASQMRNTAYRNLIVDVRLNGGGNTFLLPPLVQAVASFAAADTTRQVYVITSRHTFSAAQNFASKLEWLLNPVFVGEPTGSAPNFTGELTATVLPYSGLSVNISNRYHMNADWEDRRQWIAPDLPAPLTSADFFGGRDPALQAIIDLVRAGS